MEKPLPASSPDWLDVVTHRFRSIRAPFLLILQHQDIAWPKRLAAPISLPIKGDSDHVAPRLSLDGIEYRVRILDMGPVSRNMFMAIVTSAAGEREGIMNALDCVLYGYPVGRAAPN